MGVGQGRVFELLFRKVGRAQVAEIGGRVLVDVDRLCIKLDRLAVFLLFVVDDCKVVVRVSEIV